MNAYLLFVYNADAGLWNALIDGFHKIISPKTYPCSLCAITYGKVKMKTDWRNFVNNELVNFKPRFLHKDELIKEFGNELPKQYQLPAVFWVDKKTKGLKLVLTKKELDQLTLEALKEKLISIIDNPLA